MNCVNGCGLMTETAYENVTIDICKTCIGVWLDFSEVTSIIETKERSWTEEIIRKVLSETGNLGIPLEENYRDLNCPKCGENIPPTNYQYNSGIIVNTCLNNHGMWLDAGELAKIQIFMENRNQITEKESPRYQKILIDIEADFKKRNGERKGESPSPARKMNVFLALASGAFDLL